VSTLLNANSADFFDALLDATRKGKVRWTVSPYTDEYIATVPGQIFLLRRVTNDNGIILQQRVQIEARKSGTEELLFEVDEPLTGTALELFREIRQLADTSVENLRESVKILQSL